LTSDDRGAEPIHVLIGPLPQVGADLRELITKYHESHAYQIAEVYAFRNQSDEAFVWLDRAHAQRDGGLIETKVDPLLKNLERDPRYTAFLNKIHLPTICRPYNTGPECVIDRIKTSSACSSGEGH